MVNCLGGGGGQSPKRVLFGKTKELGPFRGSALAAPLDPQ